MADNQGGRGQRESYTLEARICARRDLQEANLESTYAVTLVVRAFRTAMAIAARFDLEVC